MATPSACGDLTTICRRNVTRQLEVKLLTNSHIVCIVFPAIKQNMVSKNKETVFLHLCVKDFKLKSAYAVCALLKCKG